MPQLAEPRQSASHPEDDETDEEKALNAAAAREVSRELDALMFNSPIRTTAAPEATMPLPSPPASPPAPPSRGRLSIGAEHSASPTSSRFDLTYVRERDRSTSIPNSPVRSEHEHERPAPPRRSPLVPSSPVTSNEASPPLQPPPAISLRSSSPASLSLSIDTPYRTPMEFPWPPTAPPSFYNLPSVSGSGTFSPGGTKTVSAAIFKRQLRSPSSPPSPGDAGRRQPDVNPLVINKRGIPASPRLPTSDPFSSPRVVSNPNPITGPSYLDPQPQMPPSTLTSLRPSSAEGAARPHSIARPAEGHGEEDEYDYISAYVDEDSSGGETKPASTGGYGQGHFATNLEDGQR